MVPREYKSYAFILSYFEVNNSLVRTRENSELTHSRDYEKNLLLLLFYHTTFDSPKIMVFVVV